MELAINIILTVVNIFLFIFGCVYATDKNILWVLFIMFIMLTLNSNIVNIFINKHLL